MTKHQIIALSHKELITELEKYFCIEELVDETVFKKFGRRAWRFFDRRALDNLLWIRIEKDKSITINDWKWGGHQVRGRTVIWDERGLRTNISPLVKKKTRLYLSGHLRGGAFDFNVKGETAQETREWLVDNADDVPHKCRLENTLNGKQISWVHMDVDDEPKNPKVYLMAI